ncbi:helix-turn-helix transcriptional regulator [Emticicia sp. W12TSBA100-4]|uniref:helix-turn-helix domain-containing protein n=1 Tax=Emticicia sp. W12TSBA100-4 TaxID=3160965 RepID=UPI003305E932
MDISKTIIEIRERKKIKQSELANKLGIDQPNYSRLEKRGEKLTVEQLKQIASALGVEINELLGIEVQSIDIEKVKRIEKRVSELEKLNNILEERNKELQLVQDENKVKLNSINRQLTFQLMIMYQVGRINLLNTDLTIAKKVNVSEISQEELQKIIYSQNDFAIDYYFTQEDKREIVNKLTGNLEEEKGFKVFLDNYDVIRLLLP